MTDIAGATGPTYTLVAADIGSIVAVRITATNSAGVANATSLPTTVITGSVPANIALPSITGSTVVGGTVNTSNGAWTGTPAPTFTYLWFRNGVTTGITTSSYTTTTPDIGANLTARVTATNVAGSANATSLNYGPITAASVVPSNTVAPIITGSAAVGQTLVVSNNGTWLGNPVPTYTYQWRRGAATISGATSSSYLLVTADLAANITCVVTGTNIAGNANATSNILGPVAAQPVLPANTAAPTVVGAMIVGTTLTIGGNTWTGTPTPTFAYQWLRGGSSISGATASTYTLVSADFGTLISVTVTATNIAGSASATSATRGPVTVTAVSNSVLPVISGSTVQGGVLTTTDGTWAGSPTFTYQWKRGTTNVGSNANSYATVAGDVGSTITVTVTGTNAGGSASATSLPTSAITGAAVGTMTLAWVSSSAVLDPVFSLTFSGALVADTMTLQVDDNSDFSSLYGSEANTLDSTEVAAGTITYSTVPTLLGGVTYYARVKLTRSGVDTFSNTVNQTMVGGVDPLAPIAPVMTWVTPAAVVYPQFDIDLQRPVPGDIVRVRRSSNVVMTSPTTYSHTLTTKTASFGAMPFGMPAEADGLSYWQAQHERSGHASPWSSIQTVTVAAVAVPSSPATMGANAPNPHTFSVGFAYYDDQHTNIQLFGPESAARVLVVAHGTGVTSSTGVVLRFITDLDLATGNPAGTVMTKRAETVYATNGLTGIYTVAVPTGSSGRLTIEAADGPGAFAIVAPAYTLAYAINPAPTATSIAGPTAPADPYTSPALTIPSGGFALAVVSRTGSSAAITWAGGYSSLATNVSSFDMSISLAKSTTAGSSTPTANRGNGTQTALAAAAFGA